MLFLRRILPYVLLAAAPAVLLGAGLLPGNSLVPADLLRDVYPWRGPDPHSMVPWNPLRFDGVAEFYPWRLFYSRTLHEGLIPLWNPYQFCGAPFLANSQSAVLYPLNVIFAMMPVASAFGASAWLHMTLTGWFLYAFFRRAIGVGAAPAVIGGVMWQLSAWQVSWLALPTFLDTSCWIPLALLLTHRLAEKPGVARSLGLGGVLGLMLLAGHLQIALYGALLVACYAVFCAVRARVSLLRALSSGITTVASAVMLAAPQLLPIMELARVSHRAGGAATLSGYAGYLSLAMPSFQLIGVLVPGAFGWPQAGGYWGVTNFAENAAYAGAFGLLLAAAALWGTWRASAQTRFFGAAAAAAMLLAIGTPLNALLYFGLPGFGQTGLPARVLVLWTLCASVLGAIGAEAILNRVGRLAASLLTFVVTACALSGIAAVMLQAHGIGAARVFISAQSDWLVFAAMTLAAVAVCILFQKKVLSKQVAGALLAGLVFVDLQGSMSGYNSVVPVSQVYADTPVTDWLKAHAGTDRIMPVNKKWSLYEPPSAVLPPNAATVYGLSDLQGYDSLQTLQYKVFANGLNGGAESSPQENGNMLFTFTPGSPQARESAARYLVAAAPIAGMGSAVPLHGPVGVYEDVRALPRARIVGGSAELVSQVAGREEVRYRGDGDLVVADQWFPGWHAYQNGRSVALREGPDVFRTLSVTGAGVVTMRYEPESFRLGLYLGGLALLALSAQFYSQLSNGWRSQR